MKIKTITKKKLSKKICKKVLKSEVLTREKYENYSFCGDKTSFKCGLYFLFNEEYEILYIGMVGTQVIQAYTIEWLDTEAVVINKKINDGIVLLNGANFIDLMD